MYRIIPILLALAAPAVLAKSVEVTQWRAGLIELSEGWAEHDGDNPAWANPAFDDSGWMPVDLENLGAAETGWRWYRRRVNFGPDHAHVHLLIEGGDGTYELFVNGARAPESILRSRFAVSRPIEKVFALQSEDGDFVLALRTHTPTPYTIYHLPLFLSVTFGAPVAIEYERQALESQRLLSAIPSAAINLLVILAGLGALALFASQPKSLEYLWLGLYLSLLGTSNLLLYCSTNAVIPLGWNSLLADPLIYAFTIMQIQFTFSFAGQRVGRMWRIYESLLLAPLIPAAFVLAGRFSGTTYILIEALAILPAALLLPVMLFSWYRRGNREAGWLILPSLLPAATTSLFDLGSVSLFTGWGGADFLDNPIAVGPVLLQPTDIGDFLLILAIGVVMFFRFARVSRDQARTAAELNAAREIQMRLVQTDLPAVVGCRMEAVYLPAYEVGGDFYQVIVQDDGSLMIAVGDVSGKGLKAAMTGALALGALRTLAHEIRSPGALLERLNRQIATAQDAGFITCICARISRDGAITLANAGHLAPYRNGEELELDSGFPLGLLAEAAYSETVFAAAGGDRLTFLSDGIVEARNPSGELFGFERTRLVSARSARLIAEEAQRFGQEDDITVLAVTFAPAEPHATA